MTIAVNSNLIVETQKPYSWTSFPAHFTTTLVEPLLYFPADCVRASKITAQQLKQDGVLGIMRRIGHAIRQHPLDAFVLAGSLALGYTNIAEISPLIPAAIATGGAVRSGQVFLKMVGSVQAHTVSAKSVKFTLYAATLVLCASPALGLEWNSVADAKRHYATVGCAELSDKILHPAHQCLFEGKGMLECAKLITDPVANDVQVFTLHSSNAVSIVNLDQGKVCFLTALTRQSPVIKTCFPNIAEPGIRTVEEVNDMTLAQAHQGLETGQSVRHIAVHAFKESCATFHEQTAELGIGENPICVLTALRPGGEVTQTCFNPQNPVAISLKEAKGIELDFNKDGQPTSIIVRNPKMIGLNPYPKEPQHQVESQEELQSEETCHCECKPKGPK